MIMYKVTNSGVFEKLVIKVKGKAVFYMRSLLVNGHVKSQKELLNTDRHNWFYTQDEANANYQQRIGG